MFVSEQDRGAAGHDHARVGWPSSAQAIVPALAGCGATVTNVVNAAAKVAAKAKVRRILNIVRLLEKRAWGNMPVWFRFSESRAKPEKVTGMLVFQGFCAHDAFASAPGSKLAYVRFRTRTVRSRTR
jgi:hypothetical protein